MIGNVPNGWRVEKLGNIGKVFTGSSAPQDNKYFDNGTYPFVRVSDLSKKKFDRNLHLIRDYINDICISDTTQTLAKQGTILFAKSGMSVVNNHRAILEKDSYIVSHLCAIYIDSKTTREYIFYLLTKMDMVNYSENESYPSLKTSTIKQIAIPIPPLSQQKKIVKVLNISSQLIEKQKELITVYDLFLKSKFIEMFGDPYTNHMKWKIEKFESNIDYIGDIGSNGSNAVISKNLKMLDTEDYALMVRTTNLNKDDFINNVKYVSKETYDFFKKSKIFGGEIIMNKIGSAGKFWLMPYLDRPVSLGLNQLVIRPKNLNTKFLYYLLSTDYGKIVIASETNGAVTQSITKGAIKDIDIMIPPIELQNKFASIVEKIETIKTKEAQKLEHLETLHKSLMDKAFKGEIA